jgi:heme exporter protein C
MVVPLIFVIPRMVDSLHPGNGGNPAFAKYDLDSNMRLVFWPANAGWILLGVWIATLQTRLALVKYKRESIL